MDLMNLLQLIVGGGAAGTLAYFVLGKWEWYTLQNADTKRIVAFVANALLAVVAWGAMLAMGYAEAPADGRAWVESIANIVIALGSTAFATSQAWHARELRALD